MTWARVEGNKFSGGSTARTSVSVTLGAAVTSGNMVRGSVTWGDATVGHLTSVTDDKGNAYNIVDKIADATEPAVFASFWLNNITNGPKTITANFSVSVGFDGIEASEFSGNDASTAVTGHAGQVQRSPGTGTNAIKTGSSFGASGDLRSGATNTDDDGLPAVTIGTGYTQDNNDTGSGHGGDVNICSEYATAAGAADTTFTVNSNTPVITVGVSFSPASGVSARTLTSAATIDPVTLSAALKAIDKINAAAAVGAITQSAAMKAIGKITAAASTGTLTQSAALKAIAKITSAATVGNIVSHGVLLGGAAASTADILPIWRRRGHR